MEPIELVVFDMAGTTVYDDRFVHKVLQNTMSRYDVMISLDEANRVMGIPKPVAIKQLLQWHNDGRFENEEVINSTLR